MNYRNFRRGQSARGGRFYHAFRGEREPERSYDHARREGGRHHQREGDERGSGGAGLQAKDVGKQGGNKFEHLSNNTNL
jgi:hypothetical protein